MPHFGKKRTLTITADQAYAIAADVAAYKEFIPLVQRSTRQGSGGHENFDAELVVAYDKLRLRETFVSAVTLAPDSRTVTARSSDGPIKHMETVWRITPVSAGSCEVSFTVDYALRSLPMQFMVGQVFDFAVQKIMASFEARGEALYGKASRQS
jgi:coenzyme Q-binding protein COQ10